MLVINFHPLNNKWRNLA